MGCGMPKSSMEELKGQVAAGQYAIDAGVVAGDILGKFALVRHVRRHLTGEDAARAERPGSLPRRRRGAARPTRRSSPHRHRRLK
jgi:hypothetical protein